MQTPSQPAPYIDSLVSIITPAYKEAGYIGETIQSVLDQTYPHWELIITDDKSPDNTVEVVRQWCARDSRIHLVEAEKNGGPAQARNASLSHAKGRWIAFLDSDDMWLPEKLEKQMTFHVQHDARLTFTAFRRISGNGDTVGHMVEIPAQLDYHQLLGNTGIATSTVLIDRNKAGDLKMKKIFYDDFGCWLDVLRPGGMAYGLKEDLMRYRVMNQSVSRNKWRSAKEVWKTYHQVEHLNPVRAAYYFANYALHAVFKYRKF